MKEFTQAMRKWQKSCSDPNLVFVQTLDKVWPKGLEKLDTDSKKPS